MESGSLKSGPRAAGQHARAHAGEIATRMLAVGGCAVMLLLFAIVVLGMREWALAAVALVMIGVLVIADRSVGLRFDRWIRGAEGEESVGAVLDGLAGEGWMAIHDVAISGRGNVDHVVVGPGGIFTIETKSHRGRISVDRLDPRWLKQAYAEDKLIERISGMEVQALLVFSEAYLVGSVPARRRGVTVLPARMLAGYLGRRKPVMSAQEARGVAERLANAVA
ncbi:MAG: nuclease-related domain-containing protein [Solirubrobacterales bacterium]